MSVAAVTRVSLGPIVVRFGVSMAFLGLAYFLSLTGLYVWAIEPIWSYLPLSSAISPTRLIFSCILVSALSGFISGRKPSHFYFTLCVLLIFVPSMTIYVSTDRSETFLAMVLLAFAVLGLTLAIPPLSLPSVRMKLSTTGVLIVLLTLSAAILSAIAFKGGFGNFNLNPMAVYDFRDQANQTLQGGLAYLVPIATNVAIPLALVVGIARRLRLVVLLCLGLSVLFFAFVTLKSYVVYPLVVATAYVLLRSDKPVRFMLWSLIGVVAISAVESWMFLRGDLAANWLTIFTTRRMLMIPSIINYFYVDYFSSASYYYWATSKITLGLLQPPSAMDIAELVGSTYLLEGSHANTGWIGSGYSQAGAIGVAAYSALLGLLLKYLDACAMRTSKALVSALFFVPLLTMITSSDSASVFLTQGLLFAICIFPFIAGGLSELDRRTYRPLLLVERIGEPGAGKLSQS